MKRFAISMMVTMMAATAGAANDHCAKTSEDAQNLRDDGKLLQAHKEFLECSNEACPASIRKDCVESLAKIEANIPTLVFTAKDDQGREVTAVKVTSDGTVVAEKIDGKAVSVDPGPHTFRFEAAGASPIEQRIVVREGEKNRAVAVSWEKHAMNVVVSESAAPRKASHVPAYVVGGLGLVALGVGTTFAIIGTDGFNGLKNGCGMTTSCTDAQVAPTKTQLLVADISFGVGIAALVTAVILFVTESSSSSSNAHVGFGAMGVGGSF